MGITCKETGKIPGAVPKIAIVSTPTADKLLNSSSSNSNSRGSASREEEDLDIAIRVLSHQRPHRAIPLTAAVCTAVAATVQGSVVQMLLSPGSVDRVQKDGVVRIGHPSGMVEVRVEGNGNGVGMIEEVRVQRTARCIMEGWVYY